MRWLIRAGNCVRQTSNAYLLNLGNPPQIPAVRCEATTRLGIRRGDLDSVQQTVFDAPEADKAATRAALARIGARRQAVFAAKAAR